MSTYLLQITTTIYYIHPKSCLKTPYLKNIQNRQIFFKISKAEMVSYHVHETQLVATLHITIKKADL